MYIRNDMPQFRRLELEQLSITNDNGRIEILAVQVTLNKEKWLFISIYKQPKVKIRFLTECVDNIMMKCIGRGLHTPLVHPPHNLTRPTFSEA